jgi:hypothetical protein
MKKQLYPSMQDKRQKNLQGEAKQNIFNKDWLN